MTKLFVLLLFSLVLLSGCSQPIRECSTDNYYENAALSLKYELYDNYATVSGFVRKAEDSFKETTINLAVGDEFYLPSGEEQVVSVKLERLEDKKAHFKFQYGAAPPACETVGGCDYDCQYVIENANPQVDCLGSCKCLKECNEIGPTYFIPVEQGSSECSGNSTNKTCCCSGV